MGYVGHSCAGWVRGLSNNLKRSWSIKPPKVVILLIEQCLTFHLFLDIGHVGHADWGEIVIHNDSGLGN